jgi:8-oxo-dGTP diphosphatase
MPDVYELPGGHIDFGEDITVGLKREIYEEFGMTIIVGDPFASFTYSNPIKGSHSIEVVYFAQFIEDIRQIKLDPADHSTYGWFGENDVVKLINDKKPDNNIEIRTIGKGFALLKGDSLNF